MADINDTFSAAWGRSYVNDFIDKGRVKKVMLQADAQYRMLPGGPRPLVRAQQRGRAWCPSRPSPRRAGPSGSPRLERYNGVPSVEILGMAAAGHGLDAARPWPIVEAAGGQAAAGHRLRMDRPVASAEGVERLRPGVLYALSILIVFLCLAALYESWAIPFSVIMVVPLGVLGALLGAIADLAR